MNRPGCGNGCILSICGALAALAFAFGAIVMIGQQAYARIYAYTAPIAVGDGAAIVLGMNVVLALGIVGFAAMVWAWWVARC